MKPFSRPRIRWASIYAMAIDPADSRLLYVVAGRKENPSLFVSRDAGEHWQKQADLPSNVRRLWVDPHSQPGRGGFLWAPRTLLRSVTGARVRTLPLPAPATDLSLGFGSGEQPVIYFTSERGAFRSSDGGATWRECVLPGSGAKIRAVATSLHHPDTAYLSYSDLKLDGKTWLGVAKTTNAGDGLAVGVERIVRSRDERSRRLDYDALRHYLGRESAEYDGGRPGSEPCIRNRSWPYHAHHRWRRDLGRQSIHARSTTQAGAQSAWM